MSDQSLDAMAAGFCGQLKSFVTCLHSNSTHLKASCSRKPPPYGDLSSFLLDVNDRVAEVGAQMDLLEEMIEDKISFEELLAHCMELHKQNETSTSLLESHLEQFGYTKGENVEGKQDLEVSLVEDLKQRVKAKESDPRGSTDSREDVVALQGARSLYSSSSSERSFAQFETIRSSTPVGHSHAVPRQSPLPSAVANSKMNSDDLSMLGESFSLEDFGLSATALAALSLPRSEPTMSRKADIPAEQNEFTTKGMSENGSDDMDESRGSSPMSSPPCKATRQPLGCEVQVIIAQRESESTLPLLDLVTTEEYAQLLPWLKMRVSLQELNDVVVKINNAFHMVGACKVDGEPFELDDSFLLGLGSNMKGCLVILVQIKRLEVAYHNGRSTYRPCKVLQG